jgi:hypothetical protein
MYKSVGVEGSSRHHLLSREEDVGVVGRTCPRGFSATSVDSDALHLIHLRGRRCVTHVPIIAGPCGRVRLSVSRHLEAPAQTDMFVRPFRETVTKHSP